PTRDRPAEPALGVGSHLRRTRIGGMTALDPLRQRYRRFAEAECRGYSDTYYRLALDVGEDDEVLRFVADRPVTQPNLFFAAVQYSPVPTTCRRPGPRCGRCWTGRRAA